MGFQVGESTPTSTALLSFNCHLKLFDDNGRSLTRRSIECDSSRVSLTRPDAERIQRNLKWLDAVDQNDPSLMREEYPEAPPEELTKGLEMTRREFTIPPEGCASLARTQPATPTERSIMAMYRKACDNHDFREMLDAHRAYYREVEAYTCRLEAYQEFSQAEFKQKDADTWIRTEEVGCGSATYVIWRYPGESSWNFRKVLTVLPNEKWGGNLSCSAFNGGVTDWRTDTSFPRPVGCKFLKL